VASILTIVTVATVTWSQIASPPKTARGFISSELDPRILRALESTVEGRFVGPPLGTVQAALGWPSLSTGAPHKPVALKLLYVVN